MCYIWQMVTLPLLIDLQGGTKKYNRGGRKEGDLATAFDRPSFLTQRYVLRRCGLVAVLLLQKFYSCVAAVKHALQFNVCLFAVPRFGP